MNILEFYRECESKYDHLPGFNKDDAEKILKDAKPGALLQLKTLFGKDKKLMFYMLQYLLMIPLSIKLHKMEAKLQRKKSRFQERIEKKVRGFISLYRTFNPDVDDKTLKDMTLNCFKMDKSLRLEAEILNDTIMNYTKDKTWQGKINEDFKDIIYNAYIMAKGKSDNIAKLLVNPNKISL